MSELIDRQALRAAHGLGTDCADCKQDARSCQYDRDFSRMDFCEWIEDAPTVEPASPWHRAEDNPPKPGCYLTASPFFHGDDYSWLYRLAWWTEHGLMDFVQDAEKESGWYIWNNSQDRDTEIEPMYWMPIEPPKEGK